MYGHLASVKLLVSFANGALVGSVMGWHAFCRGTACDRLCDGDSIQSILLDGGWRSSAVLSYLITDEVGARINGVSVNEDSDSELE